MKEKIKKLGSARTDPQLNPNDKQSQDTAAAENLQAGSISQQCAAPGQVQSDTVDDLKKWVTDSPDDVILAGWIDQIKRLDDSDRCAIKMAVKAKTGAKASDLNQQLNAAIKVWKKEAAKAISQGKTSARETNGIVEIVYDPVQTGKVSVEAAMAIVNDNTPKRDKVFRYGDSLVSIQDDHPKTVRQVYQLHINKIVYPKMLLIKKYCTVSMRHRLEKSAVSIIKSEEKGDIPKQWTKDTIEGIFVQNEVDFPILTGLINHPFVGPNGDLVTKHGHDTATGLYIEYADDLNIKFMKKPTQKNVRAALNFLTNKVLADFRFAEDIDKISAVAAFMTAIQRKMITGDSGCPGFLFDAPTQSSGKTTLAQAVSYSIYGRSVAASSWSDQEAEMAKLLLAIMLEGHGCVLFDNIAEGSSLKSNALAKAMTGNSYSGRELGHNKTAIVPSNVFWLFTGNNITICGDFNTRVIPVRLDSRCADPDRRPFTRPDIGEWCLKHRAEIIKNCLILVMADCSQLSKRVKPTRYPDWDKYVRLPLLAASGIDVADKFQQNKKADPESEIKLCFLKAMFETFGTKPMIASRIVQATTEANNDIRACLNDLFSAGSPTAPQLGKWLCGFKDQIIGGYRLSSSTGTKGEAKNRTIWKVDKK